MANTLFTKVFDKYGIDMNLGLSQSHVDNVYNGQSINYDFLSGSIYFPKVSVGLIESQQLFLLQEVIGPTSSYELRKISGSVTLVSGNSYISGSFTDFTSLTSGLPIKIDNDDYTIIDILGATVIEVSPIPTISTSTSNIYRYDYVSYNTPRSSTGTYKEQLNIYFENEDQTSFFLYDVDYTEDVPYISKSTTYTYQLEDGSSDIIDNYSGKIILTDSSSIPVKLNIGFSSSDEDVYQETLKIDLEKQYMSTLLQAPVLIDDKIVIAIGGTSNLENIFESSEFYFQGVTGATVSFEKRIYPDSIGASGSTVYIVFDNADIPLNTSLVSTYRLLWKNVYSFASFIVYGETEAEDERFRLVLENFGQKIDFDKEYIFRDSDINEGLPDYELLNTKRKELLLESHNIYPYLGSYKSLINIINYFGYYDLDIKEYFLNVDEESPNYDKYMHVLIPRDDEQRLNTKSIWEIVPSKIWKKTSYFGLFYNLNEESGETDQYGVPIVVDSFQFSPEEVLIKLFGLKELLKAQFLPLNARIIDITGEGIYFERIRVDSWSDSVNRLSINLGEHPTFTILPEVSYISDLRIIDSFYVNKFVEQGLTGFVGISGPIQISATGSSATVVLNTLYDTFVSYYTDFYSSPYNLEGELVSPVDNTWQYMPPSIYDPNFNNLARRIKPLPDDKGIVAGAPILLESTFDIAWEDCSFDWAQLGILGPTGAPLNINIWTWDSLGIGQNIDWRWIIQKNDMMPFSYDSGRRPISDFAVNTRGATVFSIPAKIEITSVTGPTGGPFSIETIQITNSGYGYTTLPTVSILGTTGATAIVEITLTEGGYITGGTVSSGGSGYLITYDSMGSTVYPTVTVENPTPVYEDAKRYLHAVSLPYEGTYDMALYLYDITNTFTVEYKKHTVNSRNVEFVSLFKKETPERTWEDFETLQNNIPDFLSFGETPTSGARLVEWDEVTGPWYYPIHIHSSWDDAKISWESLDFAQYKDQSLYEQLLDTTILEINRESQYVTLQGDLIEKIDVGDSLFFSRSESAVIQKDISISGLTSVDSYTLAVDITGYSMKLYSRVILTDTNDYSNLDPNVSFYAYGDCVQIIGNIAHIRMSANDVLTLLTMSASLYLSWGLFDGTYAIQILSKSLIGGNTRVNLIDSNKELYYMDSNFSIRNADYDVDYAENRIGVDSLVYEKADETTWDDIKDFSWFGLEYHSTTHCGFDITAVAPGGFITIDEFPSFQFSGNYDLVMNGATGAKQSLLVAVDELTASTNEGIRKFDYSVMPSEEIYLKDPIGNNLIVVAVGASSIEISDDPNIVPEHIWTGLEWRTVISYNSALKILYLDKDLQNDVEIGSVILLPYNYHNQLVNSDILQQFYFFIHAEAVNPSLQMLSYVNFDNGVQGEWLQHPDRTYSYPLKNSLLTGDQDYIYNKWTYEGSDYPPLTIDPVYASDIKSLESRIPYAQTLQCSFSFTDTVISNNQQTIPTFTPVMFNYDECKIPGKTNPIWTIIRDEDSVIQVMSNSKNLVWNFTKDGNYSVSLQLEDSNGNKIVTTKNSFVVVGQTEKIDYVYNRTYTKPVSVTTSSQSINILA